MCNLFFFPANGKWILVEAARIRRSLRNSVSELRRFIYWHFVLLHRLVSCEVTLYKYEIERRGWVFGNADPFFFEVLGWNLSPDTGLTDNSPGS